MARKRVGRASIPNANVKSGSEVGEPSRRSPFYRASEEGGFAGSSPHPLSNLRNAMYRVTTISIVLVGLLVISTVLCSRPKFDAPTSPATQNVWVIDQYGLTDVMPRPVKRFNLERRASEVAVMSFEFLRPYLGREGPNFTESDGEPSAGAQYLANAELYGQEAASTTKFELVDQRGNVIQLLHFFKQDNALERGRFVGSVKVPGQPFRVAVSGMGIDGQPYRNVYERLFRPVTAPQAAPILPPDFTPDQTRQMTAALTGMENQALAEIETRANKYPDGVFVMPRVEISNMTYQSFVSVKGNKLGILLSYDIRFSVDGDFAHSLQVFPTYEEEGRRSLVGMEVLSEEIKPKPEPPSYATPDIYVDLKTLVQYGSEAWYKGGVVYHFAIKLIPDFVGQNANKTKFCVDEEHYKNKSTSLQVWQRMKQDSSPVGYRISLYGMSDGGDTGPFDPPKVYYDGFVKEGAVKCKPYKNSNF